MIWKHFLSKIAYLNAKLLSSSNSVNWISSNVVRLYFFYSQWTILFYFISLYESMSSFSRVTIILSNSHMRISLDFLTFPIRCAMHPTLHNSTTTMYTLMRTFYLPYTQHNLLDQITNLHFWLEMRLVNDARYGGRNSEAKRKKNWCYKLSIYSRVEAFPFVEEDSWSMFTLCEAAPLLKYENINFAINDIHLRPSCVYGVVVLL